MTTITEIKAKMSQGIKEMGLENGEKLFFHYANNAGRGDNNVTITRCIPGTERPRYTREYEEHYVIHQTRTSSWVGRVNYSTSVHNLLF